MNIYWCIHLVQGPGAVRISAEREVLGPKAQVPAEFTQRARKHEVDAANSRRVCRPVHRVVPLHLLPVPSQCVHLPFVLNVPAVNTYSFSVG
jgi:hypothetical protein